MGIAYRLLSQTTLVSRLLQIALVLLAVTLFIATYYLAGAWGVLLLILLSVLLTPQAVQKYRLRRAADKERAEALVRELQQADIGLPAQRRARYVAAMQTYAGISPDAAVKLLRESDEKGKQQFQEMKELIDGLCANGGELTEDEKRRIEDALYRMKVSR
jgi:uncharacterized protein (DUF58 family)